jgi:hypothetical protein
MVTKQYRRFSAEEHEALGADLKSLAEILRKWTPKISEAYPKSSHLSKAHATMFSQLRRLRSKGEDAAYEEGHDTDRNGWYFPAPGTWISEDEED